MAIEEVHPDDWTEKVYKPDILNSAHTLYRKPGYNPLQPNPVEPEPKISKKG